MNFSMQFDCMSVVTGQLVSLLKPNSQSQRMCLTVFSDAVAVVPSDVTY